jgi:tetratricopeptide (TPR) repeat protein
MEESESVATLLAQKAYDRAVPLLKRDLDKYPSNPRIRLQYADALAGAGSFDQAVEQYESTASYYEENGLTVQAVAVRKKSEKLRAQHAEPAVEAPRSGPAFEQTTMPKISLFENLDAVEREAVIREMELEEFDEGDVIITEGEPGTSMYIVASGEVKVFTKARAGESIYLAKLGAGDFFGEVSVLTGKPRTATITASQPAALLRLDKTKLDGILSSYPGIRRVLDQIYKKRADHTVEAMIESLRKRA